MKREKERHSRSRSRDDADEHRERNVDRSRSRDNDRENHNTEQDSAADGTDGGGAAAAGAGADGGGADSDEDMDSDEDPLSAKTYNIHISRLEDDVTSDDLMESFKDCGSIARATVIKDRRTGKSKGFGFVYFKSKRGQTKGLKEDGKKIRNSRCKVEISRSQPAVYTLYLGGLKDDVKSSTLKKWVVKHSSKILTINVKSRFAFVVYPTFEQARDAIQTLSAQKFEGSALAVEFSDDLVSKRDQRIPGESKTIYVRNIPSDITEDKLKGVFREFGQINRITINSNKMRSPASAFAFIEFDELKSAKKALKSKNDTELEGRILRVEYSRPSSDKLDRRGPPRGDRGRGRGRGRGGRGRDRGGRGPPPRDYGRGPPPGYSPYPPSGSMGPPRGYPYSNSPYPPPGDRDRDGRGPLRDRDRDRYDRRGRDGDAGALQSYGTDNNGKRVFVLTEEQIMRLQQGGGLPGDRDDRRHGDRGHVRRDRSPLAGSSSNKRRRVEAPPPARDRYDDRYGASSGGGDRYGGGSSRSGRDEYARGGGGREDYSRSGGGSGRDDYSRSSRGAGGGETYSHSRNDRGRGGGGGETRYDDRYASRSGGGSGSDRRGGGGGSGAEHYSSHRSTRDSHYSSSGTSRRGGAYDSITSGGRSYDDGRRGGGGSGSDRRRAGGDDYRSSRDYR